MMRDHLTTEEIAAYGTPLLDFRAEHEIDNHVWACERCFGVLMDSLWDRLGRNVMNGPGSGGPPHGLARAF